MESDAGETRSRKGAHIDVCLGSPVEAKRKASGFSDVEFVHNALPELDAGEIDSSSEFLGKKLSMPLAIEAITGGFPNAEEINSGLAQAAQECGIAFGVGSQRAMLEDPSLAKTYRVRKVAPDVMLIGNIGFAQLRKYPPKEVAGIAQDIEADAIAVHLNVLQELAQEEGDRDFSGCFELLVKLCEESEVPVIAKETGAGISPEAALRLEDSGVSAIDVAGAGGTSWAGVEFVRSGRPDEAVFWDWGIRTAVSTALVSRAVKIPVICSGGVRSGLDAAKGIALGAAISGAALPFLKAWSEGGHARVAALARQWDSELRMAMALTGCGNLSELRKAPLFVTGATADELCAFGAFPAEFAKRQ
jgi:isopentenyl-diphosphate delta-isomerase